MRSSTLQYLHISEFGKICAKYIDAGLMKLNALKELLLLKTTRKSGMINMDVGHHGLCITLQVMELMHLECLPWGLVNLLVKAYLLKNGENSAVQLAGWIRM